MTEHAVLNPAKKPGIYGTVHFKNLAIGIVPVDSEGYTYLVGQYRYPLKAYSWEIPEGGGRIGIPAIATAKRELKEETGITAGKWKRILSMHLSNSVSDEFGHIFVATKLKFGEAHPEEDEELKVKRLPISKAVSLVRAGKITDSLSVAGLLCVEGLVRSGQLKF